jgi:hypothetical protein
MVPKAGQMCASDPQDVSAMFGKRAGTSRPGQERRCDASAPPSAAIVLFLAGSALCGLSQNMVELILFRALQGIGGGGLIVTIIAIIGDLIPPRERARRLQHDFATMDISEFSVQRADDGAGQQVGSHDPGQMGKPAKLADDGWQGSEDDRPVERRE